ncbi:unnamed protein product, partial [Ostreobium quekettii]
MTAEEGCSPTPSDNTVVPPGTPKKIEEGNMPVRRGSASSSGGGPGGGMQAASASEVASRESDLDDRTLSLKVMVGIGRVCVFRVGGVEETCRTDEVAVPRWEFLVGDKPHEHYDELMKLRPPMQQIASIEDSSAAGTVVVSSETAEAVEDSFELLEVGQGFQVGALTRKLEAFQETHGLPGASTGTRGHASQTRVATILRAHLPDCVRDRIEAGHADFINEVRRLTVLFLGFPSLTEPKRPTPEHPEVAGGVGDVQRVVEVVQRHMRQYDGSFLQFRCDEKGFLAICAFGLPGRTHHQRPVRAVRAALKIVDNLKEDGTQTCVGITTGDLLCACVGSPARSEYTVFGDPINMSARLMCKAKKGMGSVLCDQKTYDRAKATAKFVALDPMQVKGSPGPVLVYKVEPMAPRGTAFARNSSDEVEVPLTCRTVVRKPLVERDDVMEMMWSRISGMMREHQGGVVLIEGAA